MMLHSAQHVELFKDMPMFLRGNAYTGVSNPNSDGFVVYLAADNNYASFVRGVFDGIPDHILQRRPQPIAVTFN